MISVSNRRNALLCFFCLCAALIPASASPWSAQASPPKLLNGAPVLFQIKPSTKLDSLDGTWLGHQLTFSYDASTKTWFALAGVTFETTPGKYPLELSAEPAATKAPSTFTRTFAVARASYPQIKVQLTVEKKFTEPTPEQLQQIAEGVEDQAGLPEPRHSDPRMGRQLHRSCRRRHLRRFRFAAHLQRQAPSARTRASISASPPAPPSPP